MRSRMIGMSVAAVALALVFGLGQDLNAKPVESRVTTPVKADAPGMEGKEWNVVMVELAPGGMDARLFHPGVDLIDVLEGTGLVTADDKPPIALKPGVVAAFNPKHSHVLKNTSQTQMLKVLLVQLLEKGQLPFAFANRVPNPGLRQQKTDERKDSAGQGLVF